MVIGSKTIPGHDGIYFSSVWARNPKEGEDGMSSKDFRRTWTEEKPTTPLNNYHCYPLQLSTRRRLLERELVKHEPVVNLEDAFRFQPFRVRRPGHILR